MLQIYHALVTDKFGIVESYHTSRDATVWGGIYASDAAMNMNTHNTHPEQSLCQKAALILI